VGGPERRLNVAEPGREAGGGEGTVRPQEPAKGVYRRKGRAAAELPMRH
jgi:hypothetical protein